MSRSWIINARLVHESVTSRLGGSFIGETDVNADGSEETTRATQVQQRR